MDWFVFPVTDEIIWKMTQVYYYLLWEKEDLYLKSSAGRAYVEHFTIKKL